MRQHVLVHERLSGRNGAIVPFWEKQCAKNYEKRRGEEGRRELGRKQRGLFTICNVAYLRGAIPSLADRRKSTMTGRGARTRVLSPTLPEYEQLTVFLSHETPSLPIHWNRRARRLPFRIPAHEYALLPENLCVRTIFHYPISFFRRKTFP